MVNYGLILSSKTFAIVERKIILNNVFIGYCFAGYSFIVITQKFLLKIGDTTLNITHYQSGGRPNSMNFS